MELKTLSSAQLEGKKVLARFDLNAPLKQNEDGQWIVADDSRLRAALPTINEVLRQNPKRLTLMSHLGRPKGKVKPEFSLEPVALWMAEHLNEEIVLVDNQTEAGKHTQASLSTNRILMLENLRFQPGEESNERTFAAQLAEWGEVYINDAFGCCHRQHASVYEINHFFTSNHRFAGFCLEKEINSLRKITQGANRPMMAVIGGAKVSDKIKTVEALIGSVEKIFIGGAMAYAFLKAQGIEIGKSLCRDEDIEIARKTLKNDTHQKIVLPTDHIVAKFSDNGPDSATVQEIEGPIPQELAGLDIGPKTREAFAGQLSNAKTIFWNGPMGMFETSPFDQGTLEVAKSIAKLKGSAFTLVGGGDSVAAVNKLGMSASFSHVSTGGGASLEFIENGGNLPGIKALKFGLD